MKIDIEMLWKEMEEMQDFIFYTINGLPFTIKKKNENHFNIYRDGRKITPTLRKKDMEFVINNPNNNTTFYKDKMFCASYALGVYSELCGNKRNC